MKHPKVLNYMEHLEHPKVQNYTGNTLKYLTEIFGILFLNLNIFVWNKFIKALLYLASILVCKTWKINVEENY